MPVDKQQEGEEAFRESLKDVVLVIEKLSPLVERTDDLAGMLRLAIQNSGQLRLVIEMVLKSKEQARR